MPCQLCKKKCGIPIDCLYCEGSFCTRCMHLERHDCPGIETKVKKEITNLDKNVEYKKEDKYAFIR